MPCRPVHVTPCGRGRLDEGGWKEGEGRGVELCSSRMSEVNLLDISLEERMVQHLILE